MMRSATSPAFLADHRYRPFDESLDRPIEASHAASRSVQAILKSIEILSRGLNPTLRSEIRPIAATDLPNRNLPRGKVQCRYGTWIHVYGHTGQHVHLFCLPVKVRFSRTWFTISVRKN